MQYLKPCSLPLLLEMRNVFFIILALFITSLKYKGKFLFMVLHWDDAHLILTTNLLQHAKVE